MCVAAYPPVLQARCAAAARAAEAAAAEREQLERKVARLEKAKETEHKGVCSLEDGRSMHCVGPTHGQTGSKLLQAVGPGMPCVSS
jgi:hypothetical protein